MIDGAIAADYSNEKGDFKIFKLGDSLSITKDKANWLLNRGDIYQESKRMWDFNTSTFNDDASIYLFFNQQKLTKITIIFKTLYTDERDIGNCYDFVQNTRDSLIDIYGNPTNSPNQPDLYSTYSVFPPKVTIENSDRNLNGVPIPLSINNPYLTKFPKKAFVFIGGSSQLINAAVAWQNQENAREEETLEKRREKSEKQAESEYSNGSQRNYTVTTVYEWDLQNKRINLGVAQRQFGCFAAIEIVDINSDSLKSNDFN